MVLRFVELIAGEAQQLLHNKDLLDEFFNGLLGLVGGLVLLLLRLLEEVLFVVRLLATVFVPLVAHLANTGL